MLEAEYVVGFETIGLADLPQVGGKNASLGEMIRHLAPKGIQIPGGFATTASAFRQFLNNNNLTDKIDEALSELNVNDVAQLAKVGNTIREWILQAPFLSNFENAIRHAYEKMSQGNENFACAVRSSATAEDLPNASFAGQQETFLNVQGIENVLAAVKAVFASLYNDRAIAYRVHQGFAHDQVALSVGIQHMVRSDLAASGVIFSLDTESGFEEIVFITSSYGLGEMVVQGAVNPDEFYIYKPSLKANRPALLRRHLGSKQQKMIYTTEKRLGHQVETVAVSSHERRQFSLTEAEIHQLARQAVMIETHYGRPMDIEWAKDGLTQTLYIVQARPETVQSRKTSQCVVRYALKDKAPTAHLLAKGRSIGQKIGQGPAKIIKSIAEMDHIQPNDVLVTDMTDPDWEPIMKRASAIVTNRGGRTCHAAIIARELGIPAVVGCIDATENIQDNTPVTVSCAQGDMGYVYEGILPFEKNEHELDNMPALPFKIMMNVAHPERAFSFRHLPHAGVGLARLEFVISQMIGIHPKACLEFDKLPAELQAQIELKSSGYATPVEFYKQKLIEGIATLAAAFAPERVIVRCSDFKSNEYANLLGGKRYEPLEENPMLGFRGASRYVSDSFADCFALECEAIRYVREEMGLTHVEIMIPFVRSVIEAKTVIDLLAKNGLKRGEKGLKVIMMCELPTNAILAEEFLAHFDGFSIGSNDLTQLTLGLDRDSALVAYQFDERDKAVKFLLSRAIEACKKAGKYIGICGQGPSDHPDFAKWLMDQKIDSISLNPDSVLETWLFLAKNNEIKASLID